MLDPDYALGFDGKRDYIFCWVNKMHCGPSTFYNSRLVPPTKKVIFGSSILCHIQIDLQNPPFVISKCLCGHANMDEKYKPSIPYLSRHISSSSLILTFRQLFVSLQIFKLHYSSHFLLPSEDSLTVRYQCGAQGHL